RDDEDQQHRHVVEQGTDHHLVQVEALEHLRVAHHAVDGERLVERGEERVEEVAGEREEDRDQHVGDGRREVRPQLAPGDGQRVAHQAGRLTGPPEIACVYTSSSERSRVRSPRGASTTTRPSLMITTLWQAVSTWDRMCVESTIVRLAPRERMNASM